MSVKEKMKCPDCDYTVEGFQGPFPDPFCPECGTRMSSMMTLSGDEAKRVEEILKRSFEEA